MDWQWKTTCIVDHSEDKLIINFIHTASSLNDFHESHGTYLYAYLFYQEELHQKFSTIKFSFLALICIHFLWFWSCYTFQFQNMFLQYFIVICQYQNFQVNDQILYKLMRFRCKPVIHKTIFHFYLNHNTWRISISNKVINVNVNQHISEVSVYIICV